MKKERGRPRGAEGRAVQAAVGRSVRRQLPKLGGARLGVQRCRQWWGWSHYRAAALPRCNAPSRRSRAAVALQVTEHAEQRRVKEAAAAALQGAVAGECRVQSGRQLASQPASQPARQPGQSPGNQCTTRHQSGQAEASRGAVRSQQVEAEEDRPPGAGTREGAEGLLRRAPGASRQGGGRRRLRPPAAGAGPCRCHVLPALRSCRGGERLRCGARPCSTHLGRSAPAPTPAPAPASEGAGSEAASSSPAAATRSSSV